MTRLLRCENVARAALGEPAKRNGAEFLWHCPHHDDKHPSLSISSKKNVWMCGPCGARGTAWQLAAFLASADSADKTTVKKWLQDRCLLPKKARESRRRPGRRDARGAASPAPSAPPKTGRGTWVATYLYTDPKGQPLARKRRFEPGADGRKKDFHWERFEDGKWHSGLAGEKLPLYRLREIADAQSTVLVEGEKDADAGAQIGLATTTAGGVGSLRPDHAEGLRGKAVVIVADADDPGRQYAQKEAAMLAGRTSSIKVLEIPDSKDLAEAIEKGWTRERLLALFESAPKWKPADGSEVLDSLVSFMLRFVAMNRSQAQAAALWIIHTHAFAAADTTPYLAINSAEKQSGKTRLLEVLHLLVANPWLTGRVTAAVLVRKVGAVQPTLLLDESDAAFSGEKEYAEALRGVLNSGYRHGGAASVCVGQGAAIEYKDFSTFCPKAIAGIGKLPDTVADRSIPIRLKRARRGTVERFRERDAEREATTLREKIEAWVAANLDRLRETRPEIPLTLSDRQADCCEPLLAISDLAGGDWPEKARAALVELCSEGQQDDDSTGIRLLADIRAILDHLETDRSTSETLVNELTGIETSPWAEWSHGKPISKQKLARLLKPFGIIPGTIRPTDGLTAKGYYRRDFDDAFGRYLPTAPGSKRHNDTTCINTSQSCDFQNVTGTPSDDSKNREIACNDAACDVVTFLKREDGDAEDEVRL